MQFPANQVAWHSWQYDPASDTFPEWFDIWVGEPAPVGPVPEADLSEPYYEVRQALVAGKGSAAARVRTLAGVRRLRLGAVASSNGEATAAALGAWARQTVAGQLPDAAGTPDQFRFVLRKGSPLTACVNRALATLRQRGTLAKLEAEWLTTPARPILR
jgi:polar amino acid transport system substrate-binding protein